MDAYTKTAIEAARAAQKVLLRHFRKIEKQVVREKRENDFLTFVDEQSEATIIDLIAREYPDHSFLAEEGGLRQEGSEYRWIIDPLDGTKNYIAGIPVFGISIALQISGETKLGVILDPIRNDLFYAAADDGAFLNDKPLQVTGTKLLQKCLLATGFPFKRKEALPVYMACFADIFSRICGARRMGAASIDLAYVAAGRFDGFWELGLSPWDVAAGAFIVKMAGGTVTDFGGKQEYERGASIIASNGHIHDQMLTIINKHFTSPEKIREI